MIFHWLRLMLNRESRRGVAPPKTPLPPFLKKERGTQGVRLFHKSQRGFTLVELMLAIAITGVITGGITMTLFQVFDGSARTSNHMTAVRQVQNAGYWVSYHAQMAQDIVTVDDPATPGVTEFLALTWKDRYDDDHQVVYSLENRPSSSLRNLQGVHYINGEESDRTPVFEFIDPDPDQTSCVWDGAGKLIFTVTATVGFGSQEQSETRIYEVTPRPVS